MSIDPKELRRMTNEAIQRGKDAAALKAQQEIDKQNRQAIADKLKADDVIALIPGKCEAAANGEHSSAQVMRLLDSEFTYPRNGKPVEIHHAAKLVFEYCQQAGLQPIVMSWDDGCGVKGGYDIYVKW